MWIDAGETGEHFYLAGTCGRCGTQTVTNTKTDPDFVDGRSNCAVCANENCADCKYWCDCCDKTVCKACTARCVRCGEYTCYRCIINGSCAFCADDEDARMAAIAASNREDHNWLQKFENRCWFCLSAALIGLAVAGVWIWITKAVR